MNVYHSVFIREIVRVSLCLYQCLYVCVCMSYVDVCKCQCVVVAMCVVLYVIFPIFL